MAKSDIEIQLDTHEKELIRVGAMQEGVETFASELIGHIANQRSKKFKKRDFVNLVEDYRNAFAHLCREQNTRIIEKKKLEPVFDGIKEGR